MPDGELESLARQDGTLVLSYVFQRVAQDRLGPLEATLRTAAPGSHVQRVLHAARRAVIERLRRWALPALTISR